MSEILVCCIQVTLIAITAMLLTIVCRRRPKAQAVLLETALLAIGTVTLLSFCSLPNWWNLLPDRLPGNVPTQQPTQHLTSTTAAKNLQRPLSENPVQQSNEYIAYSFDRWKRLTHGLQMGPLATGLRKPSILLWVWGTGVLLGLLKLALSLQSVMQCYRHSTPLIDDRVNRIFSILQQHAVYSRPIQLRQTTDLISAATIGWLHPVIFLPKGWKDWTEGELESVLAHEIAHICRKDYPLRILASGIASLHFYHPLVYWLLRSLVEQQELAADGFATTLVGGRRRYLLALSKVAIRQDSRSNRWTALTILPVSSSFLIRRINMLRVKDDSERESVTKWRQWTSVAALAAITLGITAIRGTAQSPEETPIRVANISDPTSKTSHFLPRNSFGLSSILDHANKVIAIRVDKLAKYPAAQPCSKLISEVLLEKQKGMGNAPQLQLDQIELIGTATRIGVTPDRKSISTIIPNRSYFVRTTEAFNWRDFLEAMLANFCADFSFKHEKKEHLGYTYFRIWEEYFRPGSDQNLSDFERYLIVLDDRTACLTYSGIDPEKLITTGTLSTPRPEWKRAVNTTSKNIVTISCNNYGYCKKAKASKDDIEYFDDVTRNFLLGEKKFLSLSLNESNADRAILRFKASHIPGTSTQQYMKSILSTYVMMLTDNKIEKNENLLLDLSNIFELPNSLTPEGLSVINAQTECDMSALLQGILPNAEKERDRQNHINGER